MPDNAKAWFNFVELLMSKENITAEEDKCMVILTFVPPTATSKLGTTAWKSAYGAGDYQMIRDKLIAMHTASDDAKISQLLTTNTLGDQKPSELYTKMINLAGSISNTTVPEKLVFNRWMQELPTDLISFVQMQSDVWDASKHLPGIDALHEMLSNRRAANAKVDAINKRPQPPRDQSRDRTPRSRSPSRGRYNKNIQASSSHVGGKGKNTKPYPEDCTQCWYHWNFGARARKCFKERCNFKSKNESQ